MHGIIASTFAGLDLSLLAKFASLWFLPFAHEDLAIVAGAYIIVNDMMPTSLVVASIYGGVVASDFALYGIGAGARRLPWLNYFANERVQRFGEVLRRNIFGLVAFCRVVPGVVFIAFIACGWARVSLTRFTVASLVVSALYVPLVLYLAIVFGDALDNTVGVWAWPLLLLALVGTGLVRKRIFAFGDDRADAQHADHVSASMVRDANHSGMPALVDFTGKMAVAERIPRLLFYAPLVLNWMALGLRHRGLTLPSACNPSIPTGGMWGESKSECLDQVGPQQRRWVADYVVLRRRDAAVRDRDRALQLLDAAGIGFPLIVKPDIGWHGHGVRRIDRVAQLLPYLAQYPDGERVILQRFIPYAGEAAALYARVPGAPSGGVISLALRYFPHVVGDGRSMVRDLIRTDERTRWKAHLHLGFDHSHIGLSRYELDSVPARGEIVQIASIGNQRAGGLYRDAKDYITPALAQRFDAIARSMSEFHYGRFDLRFASVEALARGEDFAVIEINGIGGEAIDVWDPTVSVTETYRRLLAQQRLLFMIGERNRARGFAPTPTGEFLLSLYRQTRLIRRYPASG